MPVYRSVSNRPLGSSNNASSSGKVSVVQNTPKQFQAAVGNCIPTETQMVKIPQVKYVLHRRPVVYESITKEVSYVDVPISQAYETKNYPQGLQSACPQQTQMAQKQACEPQFNQAVNSCGNGFSNMGQTFSSYKMV